MMKPSSIKMATARGKSSPMKRCLFVILLLMTGNATISLASERLGVFTGVSHFVTQGENDFYNVSPNGVTGGILLPVRLSRVPLFVKVKVLYHGADYHAGLNRSYDSYIHASNAFLAGVKTWRGQNYSVQVLLGPGIHNESIYSEWNTGVASAEVFGEISVIVAKNVGSKRIGALLSIERGFTSDDSHLVTDRRLQLGVVTVF